MINPAHPWNVYVDEKLAQWEREENAEAFLPLPFAPALNAGAFADDPKTAVWE